jgi:hypothetical protein
LRGGLWGRRRLLVRLCEEKPASQARQSRTRHDCFDVIRVEIARRAPAPPTKGRTPETHQGQSR